jgi:hypothetical protein
MSDRRGSGISWTQILAAGLATLTVTVATSFLGVAGTILGAAASSMASALAVAVYRNFLDRGKDSIAKHVPPLRPGPADEAPSGKRDSPATDAAGGAGAQSALFDLPGEEKDQAGGDKTARRRPGWKAIALASAGLFVAVMAVVTIFEAVTDKPLSDTVRGTTGSGTTVFGGGSSTSHSPAPATVSPSTGSSSSSLAPTPHTSSSRTSPRPSATISSSPVGRPSG